MSRTALFALTTLVAGLAGCGDSPSLLEPQEGIGPDMDVDAGHYIYYGSNPTDSYHDAVVSLHTVFGSSVFTSPFCSATLIKDNWVMTAAHCVSSTSASRLAIYVGNDPSVDLVDHLYTVSRIIVHPSYNSATIRNDIALIELDTATTEGYTPIAPLPSAEGFTNADIGMTMNFAGFGYTETGSFGVKQQVDLPLGGLGCTVSGCTSSGDSATQISYSQSGRAGGPCSGDSGGPAFVFRGANTYVGGITSYGDAACTRYGVSTRTDAFESWIEGYTGAFGGGTDTGGAGGTDTGGAGGTDTGGADVCAGYDEAYTGSLSGTGDYEYQPGGTYYYASVRGDHEGYLSGPAAADFDLYLYVYNARSGSWVLRDSSTTGSSEETVSYNGRRGYYLWVVESYSGSGSYDFCMNRP